MSSNFKLEAETKASNVRNELGYYQEPIGDIFNLIETLNILLIKKPVSQSSMSAFFLHYKDNFLFFINSSMTLGRQYFSAAHEIYHYFYDKHLNGSICDTFKFKKQKSKNEKLADYFAVHFLMPTNGVLKYMDRLGTENITVKKVIKAQQYFKVSFTAMLVRLKVLNLISEFEYQKMKEIHLTSLYLKLGYKNDLIKPTNDTYIPQNYIEILTENFEEEKITVNAYKKYLNDVGLTIEDLKEKDFKEEGEVEDIVEETSFDY